MLKLVAKPPLCLLASNEVMIALCAIRSTATCLISIIISERTHFKKIQTVGKALVGPVRFAEKTSRNIVPAEKTS